MGKIRVGMFDYLNVKPVYHNIEKELESYAEIVTGTPSKLNNLLSSGELDISPVSSFAYALNFKDWMIVPDLSISCDGDVLSVLFCSNFKFEEMEKKRVMLTNESASAASLLKLLFYRSKIYPLFFKGNVSEGKVPESDGMLVIGDKALLGGWNDRFKYVYDLGAMWKSLYDLPFVFGLWAVRKEVYKYKREGLDKTISLLINNKEKNLKNIRAFLNDISSDATLDFNLLETYFSTVKYDFGSDKYKGLESFYDELLVFRMIPEKVILEFLEEMKI